MKLTDVLTDSIITGIFPKVKQEVYFKTPGLNPSTIVHRQKSALAARHAYEQGYAETEAMVFGRCCHTILFEQEKFDSEWAIWPADKRRYGKEWDAFKAANEGKQIIKDGDQLYGFRHALNAATAATKKPQVRRLIKEGLAEVGVMTAEEGLQCKGRLDWIDTAGSNIVDAKFTNNIDPRIFGASAARFAYHIKMGLYKRWFTRESNKAIHNVYLITIETLPPYDVAVVHITEPQLEDGVAQGLELIKQLANNIRQNKWPGVDEGSDTIGLDLPFWAMLGEQELIYD